MDGSQTATKPSYRQTFRERRRLLCLPIVLAVVISAWFALGSPKSYQSTANLWVDNPASLASSLGNANPAVLPPSQQEQGVLQELLSTQSFVLAVAQESGLSHYLATHGSGGFTPTSLLSGGGGSVKSKVLNSLGPKQVTTTVPGPQVLQISYRGPTPALTQSTLEALVEKLQKNSDQLSQKRNQAVVAYYRAQVTGASNALAEARAQVSSYLSQHPGAAGADPNLSALQTATGAASSQLTQASQKLNEVQSAAKAGGSNGSTVAVIDQASFPLGPASGKKKELLTVVGGLFAGLLISFLGAVALTPGKRDAWDADGANVVPPLTDADGADVVPPLTTVDGPLNANGNGHSGAPDPEEEPATDRPSSAGPLILPSRRFDDEPGPESS
jgi:uncharacterized protein involved in exopolysaccharide biosynthesis